MWWKKKKIEKTMFEVEKELVKAKAKFDVFQKTFLLQSHFTDAQRTELMNLKADVDGLECELINIKFKEVVNDDGNSGTGRGSKVS